MQVDEVATTNLYDENTDDSKHVLITDIQLSPIPAKDVRLHTRTFNITNFPRGTYFLSVGTGKHTQTKRFVKR